MHFWQSERGIERPVVLMDRLMKDVDGDLGNFDIRRNKVSTLVLTPSDGVRGPLISPHRSMDHQENHRFFPFPCMRLDLSPVH